MKYKALTKELCNIHGELENREKQLEDKEKEVIQKEQQLMESPEKLTDLELSLKAKNRVIDNLEEKAKQAKRVKLSGS